MANEDYLEQVRRLAVGEGFTEGGILKALADAANELKREDYQFQSQMDLKNRLMKMEEDKISRAKETQNILNWLGIFKGATDLGVFGKPEILPINDTSGRIIERGSAAQPNWLQIGAGGLNDLLKYFNKDWGWK